MNDFLRVSEDLLRRGEVDDARSEFELVLNARAFLSRTHSKSLAIDVHNLEAVFSAFEMARMMGRLGDLRNKDLDRLPDAYRRVIGRTIDRTLIFPYQKRIIAPKPYTAFIDAIIRYHERHKQYPTLITFNYDLGIDVAAWSKNVPITYGLEPKVESGPLKVLKLHGSINWAGATGADNGKVFAWPVHEILNQFDRFRMDLSGQENIKIEVCQMLPNFKPGGQTCDSLPAIVPPTFNKAHNPGLLNVWHHAADALRTAENVVVIGYSLPETDQFFKYLFALGTIGDSIFRKFWVVDPNVRVQEKFFEMLGPMAKSKFTAISDPFEHAISEFNNI